MEKILIILTFVFLLTPSTFAQPVDSIQIINHQIEASLQYQTGTIEFDNAFLTVPSGFRFLNRQQSKYVLTDLWGNPSDSSVLGLLVPEKKGVLASDSWVFTIGYEEMGYVKDDDAEDIDYDDLLKELQQETNDANTERIQQGYEPVGLIGWASDPHYDQNKKVLHWAKELKFGESSNHTLNYNLRVLGRKGVFVLNAVANMNELPEVQSNIDKVIVSVEFKDGHKYADFLPDSDHVAAWTIGGLVAGKVLAKAGFFVFLAKFWKLIAVGLFGVGGAGWKFWKKKQTNDLPAEN
jgi:uncharacterized membrane-anchored protein